jgi:phage/plasmid primase-like uncharacterized protein
MEIQPNASHADLLRNCIEHMSSNGFPFDASLKCDGQLHRFSRDSKKNQPDEWYVSYERTSTRGNPYLVCSYATWSGNQEKFVYKSCDRNKSFSHEELEEIQAKGVSRQKQLEHQVKEEREQRINYAKEIWEQAIEAPTTKRQITYLERKQVKAYKTKYGFDSYQHPVLVIPFCNSDSEIQAVQLIQEDGTKRIYGVKKGNFHVLGDIEDCTLIYVAEGYATAASIHEVTKNPVVVAADCGNLHSVISNLRSKYPNSKIVITADNDIETPGNPGKAKADEAAKAYGCSVVIPIFPQDLLLVNGKKPTDFNDLHVHCGIDEVVKQLQQAQQVEESRRFQFRSAHSLIQEPPKANWLIKSYLDMGSLGVLFGEPGSMKSFLAMDMGYCIATGREWHGFPVRKSGPVFYIAGEGFAGLSKRLRAWSLANSVDLKKVPFFVSDRPAQLLDQNSNVQVIQSIDELKNQHGQPVFVIIDTLNRNFGPGDENKTEDMTAFINNIDVAIRLRYGCAVLIVHHSPLNDSMRARGASSLRGALDWEYRLTKHAGDTRRLIATKVKDYEPPPEIQFKPRSIQLDGWLDPEDGEVMTSCVLEKVSGSIGNDSSSASKLLGQSKIAFDCLLQLSKSKPEGVHTEKRCSQAFSADRLSGQDGSNEIIAQKSTNDMLLTHSISNSYDSAGIAANILKKRKYLYGYFKF